MFSGLLSHSAAPAADFSRLQRASITFRDVAKRYGDHQVLNAINLQVEPGEVVAILGPSGSGKSTLIRLINQLESLSGGEILIDGKPTSRLSGSALRQLRSRVGFVFQQFNLYAHLTAQENITLALERVHGWEKSAAQARALALLRQVGLEEKAQQMPAQLSGGQQQRVAIARALVNRPKVLLLDEPLGALDLRLRKDMQNELKRIQQQMGITFIYVTHDQEEALTMSDTVVVMDKGRIQQIGTPEDIYNEPKNAFVADFIGESNILNGTMVRDNVVKMYGKEFPCVDGGFAPNEPVDVVIRPEDIDIVPVEQGQLVGTVTNVTFKGMQYDIIVDFRGFKWLIQTTDHSPVGARIGVKIDPDGFHIMKKSEYSGQFGDYSSYSEEYEELADASLETDEEESGDEE